MKWYKYSWLLIAALVCMVSCKEEEEEPIPIAPTLEITKSNMSVSYTQADIRLQIETKATIQEMVAEYTTDSAFGTFTQTKMTLHVDTKTDIKSCNLTIYHLNDHTKYYLRCRALNKQGSIVSKPIEFETKACELAKMRTDSVSDLTVSSAMLHATLDNWGSDTIPVVGFCFADHANVTIEDNMMLCLVEEKDTVSFSAPMENLEDNKTYYVRAYAINCKGVSYGDEVAFTTTEILLPTLSAVTISDVTYTSAKVASEVTADGGAPVLSRGICYSTLQNPTIESTRVTCGEGLGAFDSPLTNLDDGKKYYVRAYAVNVKGVAYSEEVTFTTDAYGVPTVSTSEPSAISYTTATIGGNVTADGGKTVTERGVCYSTLPNPTIASSTMKSGRGLGSYTCNLTELTNGTTYYVRAYATNAQGTSYGEEKMFTTTEYALPTVETGSVTNITYTSATAGGKVTADGGAEVTDRGVCYSTQQNPTVLNNVAKASFGGVGSYSCALPDLTNGTTYYLRAYATNVKGTVYGEEVMFATAAYGQPVVTAPEFTDITYTTAKVSGDVLADGGKEVTERGICYAIGKTPTLADNIIICGKGIGSFNGQLTGLENATEYNVRVYATNSVGTTYSEMKSFTTNEYGKPVVSTSDVVGITAVSATAGGKVTEDGGQEVTERGVCFGLAENPTTEDSKVASGYGLGSYTCNLTDLTEGTTYHVRAYATNSKGTSYGEDKTFVTTAYLIPTVTTGFVTDISYTTATAGGNATADGGQEVTEKGVCFSTSSEPTIYNTKVAYSEGGLGSYTCQLTDLVPGTTYYLRAYATNSKGTAYGVERTFSTTSYNAPTVKTKDVYNISYTSATCRGDVTSDGGSAITERGICYSTWHENPDINHPEDMKVKCLTDTTGIFTCDLTDLSPGWKYYYRAYAINSEGVAYGDTKTFSTTSGNLPKVSYNDILNLSYTSVDIVGYVSSDGGLEVTERGICYSTGSNPTIEDSKVLSGTGTGDFTCHLTDLQDGTTYRFRMFATNIIGTAYSDYVYEFTTLGYDYPSVSTGPASSITHTTALVGGYVSSNGGQDVTERGICISRTNYYPTVEEDSVIVCGSGLDEFTHTLTNLADGTTYYYRAYAKNAKGVGYGGTEVFTTTAYLYPTVSTKSSSNVSYTTATVGGEVTSDGGLEITEYGICISTTHNYPTVEEDSVIAVGIGMAEFNLDLTSLKDGTTYYYRAYAKNAKGVGYGNYYSFSTTSFAVPTVSTTTYSDVMYTTATVGGEVTADGGLDVTEYGICISRSHGYPTYEEDSVIVCGSGVAPFTHDLTNLADGTTYYYRAFAKNAKGVGYGSRQYFTTQSYYVPSVSSKNYSNLSYTSVTVGGEVTSGGNLEVTEYGICISRSSSDPTIENDSVVTIGSGLADFTYDLTNLQDGTYYSYRAYAKNAKGVGYGSRKSFTTKTFALPSVSTKSYSNVSYTSATVGGNVTADGGLEVTEFGICISQEHSYPTYEEDSVIVCGTGTGEFTTVLTLLQDGKTYYYRAFAKNAKGVQYGTNYSFTTTTFEVPSVSTTDYSNVEYTTATVGGKVTADGGHEVTEYGICISREHSYPTLEEDSVIPVGVGLGEFTLDLTDLQDGTQYNYRAYAKNAKGVGYGSRNSFTTKYYYAPSVSTKYYSNVMYTTATVGGEVTSDGNLEVKEYGICISRTNAYPTLEEDSVIPVGVGLGEFTLDLTDLQDGTQYNYRAYAKNLKGVGYGGREYFTTKKFEVPSVSTTYYSNVSYTSATVGGNVTDEKGHEVTERGICISRTNDNPTYEADSVIVLGSGLGEFTHDLTNLMDGTRYSYRAFAKSSFGIGYGNSRSFWTSTYPRPSVSTYNVSDISYFSVKLYGWSDNNSEHPTQERGFCYSTAPNPTINDTKIIVSGLSGDYNVVVDGLEAGTTYYVRAYAFNEYSPKYGDEKSFTTLPYSVPTLTTNDPTSVSFEYAVCGGKVTAYGGKDVTEYGICYSTSQNPTIYDSKVSGEGTMTNFLSGLENLNSNQTYYYRAFATNEEGTGYGEEKSFTTVDYNAAVIYYMAENKLTETTWGTGLHTDAFGVTIESHTFENGQGTIRFTDKITKVKEYAFERCTEMTSVTLPYSITDIEGNAFLGCTGLVSFEVPQDVQNLNIYAFSECYNIESYNVHANNQYFCDVDGVLFTKDKKTLMRYPVGRTATSYTIPSYVTDAAESVFDHCASLTSVTIPSTIANIRWHMFYHCTGLKSIVIPNSVTRIHMHSFAECESLETVDIGSGVTEINYYAFDGCPNITSVTCRALTPPSGYGDFGSIDKTVVPLYVPKFSVNAYKNAEGWKNFTNILPIP